MRYNAMEITYMTNWASQECEWQGSGEVSVGRLVTAVFYAIDVKTMGSGIDEHNIRTMGRIVDTRNSDGFRQQPVWVGNDEMLDWGRIPVRIDHWVNQLQRMTPTEAFETFEKIHPFIDGNGRVGAILYNWLNGTLAPGELVFPPNVFGDPRR